jgi:hypothetical protein
MATRSTSKVDEEPVAASEPDPTDDTTDDTPEDASFDTAISQPVNANLLPVTAPDHQGINRVVVPAEDNWVPAETDPDPRLVARNEQRVKDLQEAQELRQKERQGRVEEAARPQDASPLEP